MKNFDWKNTAMRFAICYVLLCAFSFIAHKLNHGEGMLPKQSLNRNFIFALIYALFSSYFRNKQKDNS